LPIDHQVLHGSIVLLTFVHHPIRLVYDYGSLSCW
jgi:hypothetical protein